MRQRLQVFHFNSRGPLVASGWIRTTPLGAVEHNIFGFHLTAMLQKGHIWSFCLKVHYTGLYAPEAPSLPFQLKRPVSCLKLD